MTKLLKVCHLVWVFFLEYKQVMLLFLRKTRGFYERDGE
jgi:hypothetical protein